MPTADRHHGRSRRLRRGCHALVFIHSARDVDVAAIHHLDRELGADYRMQRGRITLVSIAGCPMDCPITLALWMLLLPRQRNHGKQNAR
jgi:hypothetical protein